MTTASRLATFAAVTALAALPTASWAQYTPRPASYYSPEPFRPHVELSAIAGYQLNTDVGTTAGTLRVDDAPVYGASLAFVKLPGLRAEFLWLYSNPTVHASGTPLLSGSSPLHVPTHYFQLGGSRGVRFDKLEPFIGATIGATLFLPSELRYSNGTTTTFGDTWRFGFTIGGGLNFHITEKIALQGQVRLAAPVYFSSTSFYVGSGGAGLGVSGGIPLWQWNFMGGLVFSP
jgi:opacity protein-like surface antigen